MNNLIVLLHVEIEPNSGCCGSCYFHGDVCTKIKNIRISMDIDGSTRLDNGSMDGDIQ
jgi:hypothetical protein